MQMVSKIRSVAIIDLLEQLPFRQDIVREYRKGQIIYTPGSEEDPRIHLIQEGRVIIKSLTNTAETVGLEILEKEDVFGLEALVGPYVTLARCAEYTRTLSWDAETIERLQHANPELAIALFQAAIKKIFSLQRRIEDLASMKVQERLAAFLIEKARKSSGSIGEDGGITLPPITHETLSHFIGTSREIITHYMNLFRREGYIAFDRRQIRIFNAIGFAEWVRTHHDQFEASFQETGSDV